jgi:chromosome segregation ATPase
MSTKPPDLGNGLFGYRKSAVHQIIGDRDVLLRHADGRVRLAESKVAALEAEVASIMEVDGRKDEHMAHLRAQLDELTNRAAEMERRWQHVEAEANRVAAWRARVSTRARSTATRLQDLDAVMGDLPVRVERAFAPTVDRVASLKRRLETAAGVLRSLPPPHSGG